MLQINPIPEVSTSITAFIGEAEFGPINEATLVTSFSDFTRKFGGLSTNSEMSFGVRQYFLNGGTIAIIVRLDMSVDEASVIQAYIGDENLKTGLFALDQVDLFNILCMPGVSDKTVLDRAIAYCIKRRAFLIIDPPKNINSIEGVIDTMIGKQNDGISPPNLPAFSQTDSAAIYFPWIKITNPLTGSSRTSAPSGTIAGIYARMDVQFGVWKTPAGGNSLLKGVIGLDHNVTDAKNELFTPNGINALRFFQNIGFVAWGARTMKTSPSDFKYIPIRRLAYFIEESILRGLEWVEFEPNNEALWAQIKYEVVVFMHDLYIKNAFPGLERDAYFVRCGHDTTTQSDIDLGIVNIEVGFAALKPAEFVILVFQLKAGNNDE